jgi:hypothetical protein
LLYARNCRTGFVSEIYSQVHPGSKTPVFSEEWKILLPPNLTDRHHLLLSYYGISMKKAGGREAPQLFGYTVLPLWANGRFALGTLSEEDKATGGRKEKADKDVNPTVLGTSMSAPVVLCSKLEKGYINVCIDQSGQAGECVGESD